MRAVPLGPVQAGISRIRQKGGASPDSLYDLQNGWVTADRSIVPRPGTAIDQSLPAGLTKGLCYHKGKFHVFASIIVAMADPDYVCHVLIHPTDKTRTLTKIHFAEPFLGFLYVAAEFNNGDVRHYWLQDGTVWSAATGYAYGQQVVPTHANGYVYSPSNLITSPVWAPATVHALNDVVQPSTYLGLTMKATATTGSPIMTSDTEPTWPTVTGGIVVERRYITNTSTSPPPPTGTPAPPPPPTPVPPSGTGSRYPPPSRQ